MQRKIESGLLPGGGWSDVPEIVVEKTLLVRSSEIDSALSKLKKIAKVLAEAGNFDKAIAVVISTHPQVDVVGTFKSSIPRIVLKAKKSVIIPYDAIAILSEVKSVLNIENLNEDLEKFKKLDQLSPSEDRFIPNPPLLSSATRTDKPFRLLVYFKTPKALDGVMDLLTRYIDFWDAVFLVDKEEVLFNGNLPFIKMLEAKGGFKYPSPDVKIVKWPYASFMFLLRVITRTVPIPIAVDVMSTLLHIASLAMPNEKENKKNQTKGRRLSK
jgi:hypothetical protein